MTVKYKTFVFLLVVLMLGLTSCITLNKKSKDLPVYDSGSTPSQLDNASENQASATEKIDKSIAATIKHVSDPKTPPKVKDGVTKEQGNITEQNKKLKENIVLLEKEAEAKKNWEEERSVLFNNLEVAKTEVADTKKDAAKEIAKAEKERDEYKERFDNMLGKMIIMFTVIGGLMIPLGLIASFKQADPNYLWGTVFGVMLIVSARVINWIQDNWIWIACGLGAAVAAGIARLYYTSQRTVSKQVRITEQLKEEIKALPVQDEHEKLDASKNPKLVLQKMFGDKHTDGEAGRDMDPITRKAIAKQRQLINKEWSATVKP